MAKAKGGLGRGLDSLISNAVDSSSSDRLTTVAIADIQPGRYQARVQIDDEALQELADSIKAQGIIQPVIVRERGLSQYGLIENLQRENLNPIEEAQGLKRLADEFGLTHETIAKAVGKSRSAISNSLRLLSLPEPVQEMLYQRRLEMGHARALLTLHVVDQLELAQKAVKNGWSVREVERRSQLAHQKAKPEATKTINPDIRRINDALTEHLGVNAEVKTSNQKKGKIVLHFDTPETFEYLLKQLGINQAF